jgi:hypothetical protein
MHLKLDPDAAEIPMEKLREYLLSPRHPDGRGKAAYLARLGYTRETWQRLEADLRRQHLTLDASPGKASPYGRKYEILGSLLGPNGHSAWVRTIWIVLSEETAARLVTLIPEKEP